MTVISLVEQPSLEWVARINYLSAKDDIQRIQLYAMDMLWSIAKRNLTSDIPMPSEIWDGKHKNDRRTGKQIIEDLLKGLGGE